MKKDRQKSKVSMIKMHSLSITCIAARRKMRMTVNRYGTMQRSISNFSLVGLVGLEPTANSL